MPTPLTRRGVLAAGVGAAAAVIVPTTAAQAAQANPGPPKVGFTLNAETLDGGEQVTALTLDVRKLGPIDPASLSTSTFAVHAKATSPVAGATGADYDGPRPVTKAGLDRNGNIVLELSHGEGVVGAPSLGYVFSRGRNVQLKLAYTITQQEPLQPKRGKPITIERFVQGKLSNPEVDAFSYHASGSGLKYRLYKPDHRPGKRPLIVWLHGGGEGASLADNYYDNETTLRANRGALGFATQESQRIFKGAMSLRRRALRSGSRTARVSPRRSARSSRRSPASTTSTGTGSTWPAAATAVHEPEDDHHVPGSVRRLGAGLRRRRRKPADDHRRRAQGHQNPDLADRFAGRRHRQPAGQHRPRARSHSQVAGHPLRQRDLGRVPVPRPLVLDLPGPQRPEHPGTHIWQWLARQHN